MPWVLLDSMLFYLFDRDWIFVRKTSFLALAQWHEGRLVTTSDCLFRHLNQALDNETVSFYTQYLLGLSRLCGVVNCWPVAEYEIC